MMDKDINKQEILDSITRHKKYIDENDITINDLFGTIGRCHTSGLGNGSIPNYQLTIKELQDKNTKIDLEINKLENSLEAINVGESLGDHFKSEDEDEEDKLVFVLDGEELKAANKWMKKQRKKNKKAGKIGDCFEYVFSFSGIGVGVSVKDALTGKSKDITDYDKW
jgi:hypothetical protein